MNLFKKHLWLFATALLSTSALMSASTIQAQTPREDFKRDITLSASNYVAYRGPQKQLSPAPKGYKPFYLSHYGRHGSRYMIGKAAYDVPYFSLLKAKQEGKLTPKGEETLRKVALIREDAKGRDGELTPLGFAAPRYHPANDGTISRDFRRQDQYRGSQHRGHPLHPLHGEWIASDASQKSSTPHLP